MRLGAVGGRQIGDDDAGAVLAGFLDAELAQKARPRFGDHRDHRVVTQVVGGVDIGDPHGQLRAVAELVFGKIELQTGHRQHSCGLGEAQLYDSAAPARR